MTYLGNKEVNPYFFSVCEPRVQFESQSGKRSGFLHLSDFMLQHLRAPRSDHPVNWYPWVWRLFRIWYSDTQKDSPISGDGVSSQYYQSLISLLNFLQIQQGFSIERNPLSSSYIRRTDGRHCTKELLFVPEIVWWTWTAECYYRDDSMGRRAARNMTEARRTASLPR